MPSADIPVRRRTFAFTEYQRAKNSKTDFYITEVSRPDAIIEPYPMDGAPASVVEVEPNSVEEWTILNFTHELHNFHIHQLHFRVLESDDKFVEGRMLDTINVPVALPDANWSPDDPVTPGKVRLLMRFHQNISGEFVFHCHILSHEDKGMMGLIRVVDPGGRAVAEFATTSRTSPLTFRQSARAPAPPTRSRTELRAFCARPKQKTASGFMHSTGRQHFRFALRSWNNGRHAIFFTAAAPTVENWL